MFAKQMYKCAVTRCLSVEKNSRRILATGAFCNTLWQLNCQSSDNRARGGEASDPCRGQDFERVP